MTDRYLTSLAFIAGLLLVLLTLPAAHASSLDALISGYNFDYSDGSMRIIGVNEALLTQTTANDTLAFNLTTNVSSSATYYFIVKLFENGTIIQNYTSATVSGASPNATVLVDTRLFSQAVHNYSIEVRNASFALVYRKFNQTTQSYPALAKGNTITSFADQTFQNGVRINGSR